MLQFDLAHVNVLTKIDNLSKYPDLEFNLEFYTEVQDLSYILPRLAKESPAFAGGKFESLNHAIADLVEEFGLVSFEPLAVEDKKSMMSLLRVLDRAVGYAFGGAEGTNDSIWQVAVREGIGTMDVRDVQERWLDAKEEWDEKESQAAQPTSAASASQHSPLVKANLDHNTTDQIPQEGSVHEFANNGIKVLHR